MIKTTRYCDICGKEIRDTFYQLILPETEYNGEMTLSEDIKDLCKSCLKNLHWKISELKYPDGRFPF